MFLRFAIFQTAVLLTLPLFAMAGESGEQSVAANTSFASMLGQMLGVLLLVIVLLFALAWILKRAGLNQGALNGQLAVIGAVSVGQREKIVLIQAGQEQLLIGVTANEITLLHLLSEPIEVDTNSPNKASLAFGDSFAQKLSYAITRRQIKDAP